MKEPLEQIRIYQLSDSVLFDARKQSITMTNGDEIFMEHRLKEIFRVLLDRKQDVVTREELMTLVWKDIIVSEDSITKAISDLRRFLKKNEIINLRIITIRKLGYQLVIDRHNHTLQNKNNYSKLLLMILAYAAIFVFVAIVLIRAARY